MGKRIAVVGVGALGGYVGGWLAHTGEDVTLIDFWPENIEAIRSARAGARRRHAGGEDHGQERQDHASHRDAGAVAPEADRHRLRLGEVLRHRMGDGADQAVPGARRLRRVAAELPERGAHRGRRRLGQDGGHGGLADLGRHVRARPHPPHRGQGRRQAHRVPRRRGARPPHQARRGAARHGGPHRQRQDHDQPVGRALVQALPERHEERRVGRHRPHRLGLRPQRRDPPLLDQARRRGGARRPGAGLSHREDRQDGARDAGQGVGGRQDGARRDRDDHAAGLQHQPQPARRHPAPVDGPGHPQGPPHRDRVHERLHRRPRQLTSACPRRPTPSSRRS